MLGSIGKMTELRQRIFFVIGALVVYRLGSFIPVPGVDPAAMSTFVQQGGGLLNMFNMFSGGALSRFSIFALGVIPYISASIVVQMMGSVLPSWQALKKEGESGQRKLTMYTRIGTVGLCIVQSFGIAVALQGQSVAGASVVYMSGPSFVFSAVVGLTAGSMFLMWLGEQMTERGIGNGISLLIFAGIVAGLPGAVMQTLKMANSGQLQVLPALMVILIVLLVTAFVVWVERAQRRITVNYANRGGGRQGYKNQTSHLPLKINMSGVIPPIFSTSLLMFPATAIRWFGHGNESRFLQMVTTELAPGQTMYNVINAILIVVFAYFYTAIVFNSQETADNLKRSGALIPGIRPGRATGQYIDGVLTRLTTVGAVYLVLVCLVPSLMQSYWHVPFYFGGTSLLIVVVVVMDFVAQIQAHLVSHQYDSLLKKANLRRS